MHPVRGAGTVAALARRHLGTKSVRDEDWHRVGARRALRPAEPCAPGALPAV